MALLLILVALLLILVALQLILLLILPLTLVMQTSDARSQIVREACGLISCGFTTDSTTDSGDADV